MTTTDSLAALLVDTGLPDLACRQCCNTIVGFGLHELVPNDLVLYVHAACYCLASIRIAAHQ